MTILIADDDQNLAKVIGATLQKKRFTVDLAYTAQEALQKIQKNKYELAIVDWLFKNENMNGQDLVQKISKAQSSTPIIMLSGLNSVLNKVEGLDNGADDYLIKPFYMRELVARLNAVLRRSRIPLKQVNVIEVGPLSLNLNSYEVTYAGEPIKLSNKEFQILRLLLEREGKLVSRQELIEEVWQNCDGRFISNTIDVHIKRLRQKIYLSEKAIITIRGVGYRFDKQIFCRKQKVAVNPRNRYSRN